MEVRSMTEVLQDIYNAVVNHLVTQARPAMTRDGIVCQYRLEDGDTMLKCAVGGILPDDIYTPEMEGCSVVELFELKDAAASAKVEEWLDGLAEVPAYRANIDSMLQLFQGIHDVPSTWVDIDKPLGLSKYGKQLINGVAQQFAIEPHFKEERD